MSRILHRSPRRLPVKSMRFLALVGCSFVCMCRSTPTVQAAAFFYRRSPSIASRKPVAPRLVLNRRSLRWLRSSWVKPLPTRFRQPKCLSSRSQAAVVSSRMPTISMCMPQPHGSQADSPSFAAWRRAIPIRPANRCIPSSSCGTGRCVRTCS